MYALMILSDAELDAVSGGLLNAGDGGTGGSIAYFNNMGDVIVKEGKLVLADNSATASGGNGGSVTIKVSIGHHH